MSNSAIIRITAFIFVGLLAVISPWWLLIISIIIFVILFPSPYEVILIGSFIDFSYGLDGNLKAVLISYSFLGLVLVILSILVRPRLLVRAHLKKND